MPWLKLEKKDRAFSLPTGPHGSVGRVSSRFGRILFVVVFIVNLADDFSLIFIWRPLVDL